MRKAYYVSLCALTLLFISAAAFCHGGRRDPVVRVADGDPEMAAAMRTARETLGDFDRHLGQADATMGIKVGFRKVRDPADREYCWLIKVAKTPAGYTGELNNEPGSDIGHRCGEVVAVGRDEVADWFVKDHGPAIGNYTLRVLMKKMDPEEAERCRRAMGW